MTVSAIPRKYRFGLTVVWAVAVVRGLIVALGRSSIR
jgi:hypothetical protein